MRSATQSARVLDIHIDSKLSWNLHGEALATRLCRAVFLLRRVSCTVDCDALRMTYFAVFHSLISYCVMIWGHSAMCGRIFALQRRAVRIVAGIGFREDCKHAFVSLGILTLPSLYIYRCLQYIKKNITQYNTNNSIHDHNTRGKDDLRAEKQRINKGRCSTNYWAVRFHNCLPENVRQMPGGIFEKRVKKFLLDNAFYCFNDYIQKARLM